MPAVALLATAAAWAEPAAAALPPAAPGSVASLMQVLFSLAVVVAAIVGTAWLLRRMGPAQFGRNNQLKVVAGAMVGPKERVVVVELQNTWLVLGVTAAEITHLHTLDKPPTSEAEVDPAGQTFAARFVESLKRRATERQP
ncbi:flagellar biosynthetic protein FliO [Chitinimonas lacunae]|uniref:Flagellar protein n=1 Tax=Chitinimonas lacunae TaxID=1963018 RepID=A0ABV8MTZ3_9NEIS